MHINKHGAAQGYLYLCARRPTHRLPLWISFICDVAIRLQVARTAQRGFNSIATAALQVPDAARLYSWPTEPWAPCCPC